MRYAQIDGAGLVVGWLDTDGTVNEPNMIECQGGPELIGHRWDGAAFVAPVVTDADLARAELVQIDRDSGMPRLLRETLLAIAGASAPAKLVEHETKAAAARARLV